jgi:ubiquinone/menaquinone biosynthesis C-methylase UbiE
MAFPFDDASFDIVICQFSVMFFPDRAASYREAFRVLSSFGRFIFNVWDRIEYNGVTLAVSAVAAQFGHADIDGKSYVHIITVVRPD